MPKNNFFKNQDITSLLININIISSPGKIFLHVGTNDLDNSNDDQVLSQIQQSLTQLREHFPSATIYVSSLVPRKDRSTDELNLALLESVDIMPKTRFVCYQTISTNMLNDNKHLNKEGFSLLLKTIRFTLFGTLPKLRRPLRNTSANDRYRRTNSYANSNN